MFLSKDTNKKTLNTNKQTKKGVYKFLKIQIAKYSLNVYIYIY
jgi:hypothetical protein